MPLLFLPSIFPSIRVFSSESPLHKSGQSIGASTLASVLLMNIQGWCPLGLTGLISLQSKGLSRVVSSTAIQKHQFFSTQPSLWSNSHIRTQLLEKLQLWLYWPLSGKWCPCFFSYTVYVCHSFPSKEQASLHFMTAVIIHSDFEAQENKTCHCFPFSLFYLPWSDGPRCHDISFLNAEF